MNQIRCLYLEDTHDHYSRITRRMKRAMELIQVEMKFERASTVEEAEAYLRKHGQQLHAYFCDLHLGDGNEPGLESLDEAKRYDHLRIIGVTDVVGKDDYKLYLRFVKTKYPCLFKEHVLEYDEEQLCGVLMPLLMDVIEPTAELDWDPRPEGRLRDHLSESEANKLNAVIETVGRTTLTRLVQRIIPTAKRIRPHYLTPGFSGAAVLRVDVIDVKQIPHTMLLKLSRNRKSLEAELDNAPKLQGVIYAPYLHGPIVDRNSLLNSDSPPWTSNGWHAIAMEFVGRAVSFYTWVTRPVSDAKVEHVMRRLMLEGLGPVYQLAQSCNQTPLQALEMDSRHCAKSLHAAERLKAILEDPAAEPETGGHVHLHTYERFLNQAPFTNMTGSEEGLWARPWRQGTHRCMSHGDLHLQNILMTGDEPTLIDAGRRGEKHWATDPARLCADLWIAAWDRGPESHFWKRLHGWNRAVQTWLQKGNLEVEEDNRVTADVLIWMRDHLKDLFPGPYQDPEYAEREFRLALAVQFLKVTTWEDKSVPKRCLALMAADAILADLIKN